jgi:hypothetical protein
MVGMETQAKHRPMAKQTSPFDHRERQVIKKNHYLCRYFRRYDLERRVYTTIMSIESTEVDISGREELGSTKLRCFDLEFCIVL